MALKNENGNYLRISNMDIIMRRDSNPMVNLKLNLYESEEKRYGLGQFDKPVSSNFMVDEDILSINGDSSKTLNNNIITQGYEYLKENDYNGWIDC